MEQTAYTYVKSKSRLVVINKNAKKVQKKLSKSLHLHKQKMPLGAIHLFFKNLAVRTDNLWLLTLTTFEGFRSIPQVQYESDSATCTHTHTWGPFNSVFDIVRTASRPKGKWDMCDWQQCRPDVLQSSAKSCMGPGDTVRSAWGTRGQCGVFTLFSFLPIKDVP